MLSQAANCLARKGQLGSCRAIHPVIPIREDEPQACPLSHTPLVLSLSLDLRPAPCPYPMCPAWHAAWGRRCRVACPPPPAAPPPSFLSGRVFFRCFCCLKSATFNRRRLPPTAVGCPVALKCRAVVCLNNGLATARPEIFFFFQFKVENALPPAPSGVCHTVPQSRASVQTLQHLLAELHSPPQHPFTGGGGVPDPPPPTLPSTHPPKNGQNWRKSAVPGPKVADSAARNEPKLAQRPPPM